METIKAVESIRDAHQVDQLLGRVAETVDDSELKARILELKEQWQPIAYEVSAILSGADPSGLTLPRKRRGGRRKRAGDPEVTEGEPQVGHEEEGSCGPEIA